MSKEPETIILNNPYVKCSACGGSGLQESMSGPTECYYCNGDTVERDRDDKGRFITHSFIYKHIGDNQYEYVGPKENNNVS